MTDRESFAAFLDEAEQQLGPLDVLVNNAGIMQIGRFIDEDDLTARRMVDINLHGVILGMKLALERMIPRDRGHIVNISSQAGKFGAPGGATYSATKHAVVGLTEAVRGELRLMDAHIDLSYVMPFVVNTELGSGLGEARGHEQPRALRRGRRDRRGAADWASSKCGCPSRPSARTCSARCCRARLSEGMARAMKADRVLAGADTDRAPRPTSCAPRARSPGSSRRRPGADPQRRSASREAAERRRAAARADAAGSAQPALSQSAIRPPISGPWSSCRKWLASAIVPRLRPRRSPRRSARRCASGSTGSESAHSISVGRRVARAARRARAGRRPRRARRACAGSSAGTPARRPSTRRSG